MKSQNEGQVKKKKLAWGWKKTAAGEKRRVSLRETKRERKAEIKYDRKRRVIKEKR